MRTFSLLFLLVLLPQANAQGNDAEKLFREMEKKIRSAKSMHFIFEVEQWDAGKGVKDGKGKGTFDLDGDKFRMEREFGPLKQLSISDGKSVYSNFTGKAQTFPRQNSSSNEKSLQLLAHGGPMLFFSTTFFGPAQKFNDNFLKIKDFKLGAKEKIGERDTQMVEYVGEIGPEKSTINFSMWIDTKTKLPVKLIDVSQPQKNGAAIRSVIIFNAFTVDGTVDAKLFVLPK